MNITISCTMHREGVCKLITFEVPQQAVSTPRPRAVRRGNHIGMVSGSAASRDFALLVRMTASEAYDGPPVQFPVRVDIDFIFARPKNLIWKTKPMPREWKTTKPDRDNLDKTILDALTGLIWRDDSQVVDGRIRKMIASGDEQPRVIVTIQEATECSPQSSSSY